MTPSYTAEPAETDIWHHKGNAMVAQVLYFVNHLGGLQQRLQSAAGEASPPEPRLELRGRIPRKRRAPRI
jgi:hypothetical protein